MKKVVSILLFLLLLFTNKEVIGDSSKPHTWADGEVLTAALLNANEDTLYTNINSLDGTNLATDIAITTSGTANFTGTFKLNSISLTPTGTELNYVDGVTSAIQTQLDAKQASDADLTTYAGITPSANIQTFLGSANYSTARTNLGVAIGSDVQAYNSNLTAINQALTTTSSPQFTAVTATTFTRALSGNATTSSSTTGASASCSGNAATATTAAGLSSTLAVGSGGTGQTTTGLSFGGKAVAYTGNGTTQNVAHGLGRTPIFFLIIAENAGAFANVGWISGMTSGRDLANGTTITGVSADGTNLIIGTSDNSCNQNTITYKVFVF